MLWSSAYSSSMNLCIEYQIFSLDNGALLQLFQSIMVLKNSIWYFFLGVTMHNRSHVASSLFKRLFPHANMFKYAVPCVVSTENSTYRLLALFKYATEYLDSGVTEQEKGGVKGKGHGSEGGRQARGREGENGRGEPDRDPDGRRKGGWEDRENMGPLGGDVQGYGKLSRRRGGRTDVDMFRYLQYPECTERRVGIGIEGSGEIQCGCGGLPGEKTDGNHIHKEIGRVQGCRDVVAKLAPWRHCTLLSRPPRLLLNFP